MASVINNSPMALCLSLFCCCCWGRCLVLDGALRSSFASCFRWFCSLFEHMTEQGVMVEMVRTHAPSRLLAMGYPPRKCAHRDTMYARAQTMHKPRAPSPHTTPYTKTKGGHSLAVARVLSTRVLTISVRSARSVLFHHHV